jgi:hypothetical protein
MHTKLAMNLTGKQKVKSPADQRKSQPTVISKQWDISIVTTQNVPVGRIAFLLSSSL